jgi:hypothetical protein
MTWRERHIALVEAVNAAKTEREHQIAEARLNGFHEAIRAVFSGEVMGAAIMDADWHYMNQHIDRPMCGGVFLDWEPAPSPAPVEGA